MSDTAEHLAVLAAVFPFIIYIFLDIFPPYKHQRYAKMRLSWLMLKICFSAGVIASIFCATAGGITGNILMDSATFIALSCIGCIRTWLTNDMILGRQEIPWREFFKILREEKEQRKYP